MATNETTIPEETCPSEFISDAELDEGRKQRSYPSWAGSKKAKILEALLQNARESRINTKGEKFLPMTLRLTYRVEGITEPVTVHYGGIQRYDNPLNFYLRLNKIPMSHTAMIFTMFQKRHPEITLMDGKRPVLSTFRQGLVGADVVLHCIEVPNLTTGAIVNKPMIEKFE